MVIAKEKIRTDITSREDLELVVNDFYKKLINEAFVGKFFKHGVSKWSSHIKHVVDYWDSRIFSADTYDKSVLPIHIDIDKRFGNTFEPKHFSEWVGFWNHCIDRRFHGDNATLAKEIASRMAENIYKKMFIGRKSPSWDELKPS
ncbi:MAG: group III truncated hemoglobin [Cyclobacteriaceae bacterium]